MFLYRYLGGSTRCCDTRSVSPFWQFGNAAAVCLTERHRAPLTRGCAVGNPAAAGASRGVRALNL